MTVSGISTSTTAGAQDAVKSEISIRVLKLQRQAEQQQLQLVEQVAQTATEQMNPGQVRGINLYA
jgi:hypothetical protein